MLFLKNTVSRLMRGVGSIQNTFAAVTINQVKHSAEKKGAVALWLHRPLLYACRFFFT
jgi:hypothetical protein